ncbi:MAG: hypothetical protein KAJ10_05320 [Thermodesulfovibrionia bacterium]|nr:hypothetical protein [Thermodesulfovibrionia bacterium]
MTEGSETSRTKIGAVLVGGSFILAGVGKLLLEEISPLEAAELILLGVGLIVGGIGLRNAIGKKN